MAVLRTMPTSQNRDVGQPDHARLQRGGVSHCRAEIGDRTAQVFVGIDRRVVDADFVVDVVAGRAAGVADIADDLSANDGLSSGDGESVHVAVARLDTVAMVDPNHATVAILLAG